MFWVADRRYHHAHKCPKCKLLWEHDPPTQLEFDTDEEVDAARNAYNIGHTCPSCNTEQFECYEGIADANCEHGGGKPTVFYHEVSNVPNIHARR